MSSRLQRYDNISKVVPVDYGKILLRQWKVPKHRCHIFNKKNTGPKFEPCAIMQDINVLVLAVHLKGIPSPFSVMQIGVLSFRIPASDSQREFS